MRALPNLGLIGFFDLGEDGWDEEMSENLRRLSVLVQPVVKSIVAAVPGSPADGDVHLLSGGPNANQIAVRDAGAWVYLVAKEGWKVFDDNTNKDYRFTGESWVAVEEGGGGGGGGASMVVISQTDYDALDPKDPDTFYFIPE